MSQRRKLIVANWKMHHTIPEALAFATTLLHEVKAVGDVDVALAPPFTALSSLSIALADTPFQLAAQNVFWEEAGAFTGEISPALLADVGCRYVVIGHSERRRLFGETDEMVAKRTAAAVACGLTPIVCVGETLDEREHNKTASVIEQQLSGGLCHVHLSAVEDFVLAYEPVWAIGTGKNATIAQIKQVHGDIRNWISKKCDIAASERVRILYGGSVKPENCRDILSQKDVDGALVGGASLDAKQFVEIIRSVG